MTMILNRRDIFPLSFLYNFSFYKKNHMLSQLGKNYAAIIIHGKPSIFDQQISGLHKKLYQT
jgi:hypothetical protein